MRDRPFVAVIGLDGATWRVLAPLIRDGELPAIAALRENGEHGVCRSILPSYTTPAWQCYARGADPSEVGVYNHLVPSFDGGLSVGFSTSEDFAGVPFWTHLDNHGRSSAVINLHNTSPVDRVADGVMVAEHAEPTDTDVWPPRTQHHLEAVDYAEPDLHDLDGAGYFDALCGVIDSRFDLAHRVLDAEPGLDMLHLSIFYIDAIQHEFWGGDEVTAAWKRIDRHLWHLRSRLEDYANDVQLVLVSDHGHVGSAGAFRLNDWLAARGFLALEPLGSLGRMHALGLHRERLGAVLDRAGLLGAVRRLVPEHVRRQVPRADGTRGGAFDLVDRVNTQESDAVFLGGGVVYWLGDPDDIEDASDQLAAIRLPGGGQLFEAVHLDTDIYAEPDPDRRVLVLEPTPGYRCVPNLGDGDGYLDEDTWASVHDRDGIFVSAGPGITNGYRSVRLTEVVGGVYDAVDVPAPDGVAPDAPRAEDGDLNAEARRRLERLGYL